MPTLVRLLTILALAAGTLYAIMAALVFFVEPTPHPVSVEVPIPPRAAPAAPPPPAAAAPASAEPDSTPLTGSIGAPVESGLAGPNGTLRP